MYLLSVSVWYEFQNRYWYRFDINSGREYRYWYRFSVYCITISVLVSVIFFPHLLIEWIFSLLNSSPLGQITCQAKIYFRLYHLSLFYHYGCQSWSSCWRSCDPSPSWTSLYPSTFLVNYHRVVAGKTQLILNKTSCKTPVRECEGKHIMNSHQHYKNEEK